MIHTYVRHGIAVMSVALIVFLTGCSNSGDGNGSSLVYTGERSQATVTEANSQAMVEDSFEGVFFSQSMTPDIPDLNKGISKSSGISVGSRSVTIAKSAMHLMNERISSQSKAATPGIITDSDTVYGSCGGSMSYDSSMNTQTYSLSMTMNYNNYCEDDSTMTGTMALSGHFGVDGYNNIVSFQMNMTFGPVTITDSSESISMGGSLDIVGSESDFTLTVDIVAMDNITNESFWINNCIVDASYDAIHETTTVEIQGRFYDYENGYIDIDTPTSFKINDTDDYPHEGVMGVYGKDNSKARLTCIDAYSYYVETDADGDDVYEFKSDDMYW